MVSFGLWMQLSEKRTLARFEDSTAEYVRGCCFKRVRPILWVSTTAETQHAQSLHVCRLPPCFPSVDVFRGCRRSKNIRSDALRISNFVRIPTTQWDRIGRQSGMRPRKCCGIIKYLINTSRKQVSDNEAIQKLSLRSLFVLKSRACVSAYLFWSILDSMKRPLRYIHP